MLYTKTVCMQCRFKITASVWFISASTMNVAYEEQTHSTVTDYGKLHIVFNYLSFFILYSKNQKQENRYEYAFNFKPQTCQRYLMLNFITPFIRKVNVLSKIRQFLKTKLRVCNFYNHHCMTSRTKIISVAIMS